MAKHAATIQPNLVTADAAGRIEVDVHCVACGHNLRGLEPRGVCVECAEPVEWSLRGGYLHVCEPGWVTRLHGGARLMVFSLPWLFLPIGWVVFGLGLWRFTAPDPGSAGQKWWGSLLALARIALVGVATLAVGGTLAVAYIDASVLGSWWPQILLPGWGLTVMIVSLAVQRVVRRSNSPRLRWLCSVSGWAGAATFTLTIAGVIAGAMGTSNLTVDVLYGIGVIPAVLGDTPFMLMLIIAWRMLDTAEVHARATRRDVRAWNRIPTWTAAPHAAATPPRASDSLAADEA